MVKPCKVTYGGKEYSIEEYLGILHDGLLDQLVNDKIIDDSNFVQPLTLVEKTELDTKKAKKEAQQEVDTAVKELLDFVRKSRGTATSFANVGDFSAKMAKVFIAYAKMGIVELKDVIAKLREDTKDTNFVDENIDAIESSFN